MSAPLPGFLGEVAEVAGREAAEALARAYGGQRIKIPNKPTEKTALTKAVGLEAARRIAEHFGTDDKVVPMGYFRGRGARMARMARLIEQGASNNEIAAACEVHMRTVQRLHRKIENQDQLPLFPETDEET